MQSVSELVFLNIIKSGACELSVLLRGWKLSKLPMDIQLRDCWFLLLLVWELQPFGQAAGEYSAAGLLISISLVWKLQPAGQAAGGYSAAGSPGLHFRAEVCIRATHPGHHDEGTYISIHTFIIQTYRHYLNLGIAKAKTFLGLNH